MGTIDFECMKQQNIYTGRSRPIRQSPPQESEGHNSDCDDRVRHMLRDERRLMREELERKEEQWKKELHKVKGDNVELSKEINKLKDEKRTMVDKLDVEGERREK